MDQYCFFFSGWIFMLLCWIGIILYGLINDLRDK